MNAKLSRWLVVAVAILIAGAIYWWQQRPNTHDTAVNVKVPILTAKAEVGGRNFNKYCSRCHGQNAAGTGQGPPLIHRIYNPNHHGDQSFYRAAASGVRAHHWPYGNMPPVPDVSKAELENIIRFIRELQRHNGIG